MMLCRPSREKLLGYFNKNKNQKQFDGFIYQLDYQNVHQKQMTEIKDFFELSLQFKSIAVLEITSVDKVEDLIWLMDAISPFHRSMIVCDQLVIAKILRTYYDGLIFVKDFAYDEAFLFDAKLFNVHMYQTNLEEMKIKPGELRKRGFKIMTDTNEGKKQPNMDYVVVTME